MLHSKKLSKKSGMVLTEALVAIATLTMGVVALGSITTNAISTTILSKDYLVAGGLLNEADEIVKNIRYANWLLKPADKATCWLRLEPDNLVDCNNSSAVEGGNYIVVLDGGIWKMEAVTGGGLALENAGNKIINDKFKVYLDSVGGLGYFSSTTPPGDPEITESKFFRSINFLKKDDTLGKANYMTRVQWRDGAQIREIKKTTTLYNY